MPAASLPSSSYTASTSASPSLVAITPNDSADQPVILRQIFVGTGGNVATIDSSGSTTTHKNVASGSYIGPFQVARVLATGTTAADLIGYP